MKKILVLCLIYFTLLSGYAQTDTAFWFAAPDVSSNDNYDKPIILRISSYQQPCTVIISQPAGGGLPTQTISLPANSTQSVDLTNWLNNIECIGNAVENKGLNILSDNKISVYYEIDANYRNPEMFALKGRNALGNEFYISSQYLLNNALTYYPIPYSSFNIVASEDNTLVTITPAKDIIGHTANIPFNITLNEGQTYAAIASSQAALQHLQGSYIISSKPIAITLSDDLVYGDKYGGMCADLAGDQTVPISITGSEYIALKSNLNSPYDKVYITATQNSTSVKQDGVIITTLNAGESTELTVSNDATYIQASAPVYAYQLSGYGCEAGAAILPKINCTGSSSVSLARSTDETFVITLLVKNGGQDNFLLDNMSGIITSAQFNIVPGTVGSWYYAKITLPLSSYPNGSILRVSNSSDVFQCGVLQGDISGVGFGYFSDFNSLQSSAAVNNFAPCEGSALQLSAEAIASGTYNWTGPNGFISNSQNPSINNLALVNSGKYLLNITVPNCIVQKDSITITVTPRSFSSINSSTCSGQSYLGHNTTGTYIDTLVATNGCDSIRTLNLIVKPSIVSSISQVICNGQVYLGYNTTGTFIDTLIAANGCDSIRTLNLIVQPAATSSISQVICKGQFYLGHNVTGIYIDTFVAVNGCDSIRILNLSVNTEVAATINQTICEGQSYLGHANTGTYIDTLVATNGCDSVLTINLTVKPGVIGTISQTICQGQTYLGHANTGTYIDTLVATNGCDSVLTINLIVKPVAVGTINQSICQGQTYLGHNISGTYIDTLAATNGCDSLRTLNLLVMPKSFSIINQSICSGQIYEGYGAAGTYVDTLIASNGCDSVRTINLSIQSKPSPNLGPDTSLCIEDEFVISPGIFNSYLWQDGSTQSYFIVKGSGLFSVTVSNSCGSLTDEIAVAEKPCEIYFPNAFTPDNDGRNDVFNILNATNLQNYYLIVYNRWGEKVFETADYKKGWKGNKNNQPADIGVYVWHCKFRKANNDKNMKGTVTLIR